MKTITRDCIVIGTGAAGYNAACRIKEDGRKTVAIVTEGVNCGTSRNTGSDKQTYYKLGLGGDSPDSVHKMAENLFSGGSVDGDNALCEAALSVRCFMNLCESGVPFPVNRYGEYVGYKTDHDPFARATSAGPLTSKFMTEALQKKASRLGVEIFDSILAVEVLKNGSSVCGLLCIDKSSGELIAFRCADIVIATGGPAGIYADSVYPMGHTGSTSLALLAGAKAQNLTEWQYGLASIAPRWNVSGTYMQVLPRFVSVDSDGNEYEFLSEFFEDGYEALSNVFLKGYQWPFDSKKVLAGSSVIDLLVYRECALRGRRVFLDYTANPFGMENIEYEKLSSEAYEYLRNAESLFGKPIDRLEKMNAPAIELYLSKGVDLRKEMLEIALCAQHNNGGIAVDMWWQTGIRGLFAAGECAGTHGVSRPGGSALNAGQVGSLRASQYICENGNTLIGEDEFLKIANVSAERNGKVIESAVLREYNVDEKLSSVQRKMSNCAAAIRNSDAMNEYMTELRAEIANLSESVGVGSADKAYKYYKLRDILITQQAVLTAMLDYASSVKGTRGSALHTDADGELRQGLEELFRFSEGGASVKDRIQEVILEDGNFSVQWRNVRPIPEANDFFENIWRTYRENRNIY